MSERPADTNVSNTTKTPVTLVMSSLHPVLGIEAAAISLMDALSPIYQVRVVTIADDAAEGPGSIRHSVRSWGGALNGWKRIVSVFRVYRHRHELGEGVILLCGAWSAIPVLLATGRSARQRSLVWEHSFDSQKVKTNRNLALLQMIARPLYGRARATVTVSESLRDDMRAAGFGGRLEVVPNLVRKLSVCPVDAIPGRLATVGRLIETKNQSLALQMLAKLPERFTLDIVGDGPRREALETFADDIGVRHRVTFHGHCENTDEFYARAQIVVHPSLGETYGLVLYEAAELRKPVVAVKQSVMASVVPTLVPGALAEPQPEAFASAVLSLERAPIPGSVFNDAAERRRELTSGVVAGWRELIESVGGG